MTEQEIAFLQDIQAVLDRHNVQVLQDRVYYPGDPSTITFHVPGGTSEITIDDVAEKRGGVQFH